MNNDIKVALITGGGTGIGRSSALALQKIGFNVIICGRREGPLKETALLADINIQRLPYVLQMSLKENLLGNYLIK